MLEFKWITNPATTERRLYYRCRTLYVTLSGALRLGDGWEPWVRVPELTIDDASMADPTDEQNARPAAATDPQGRLDALVRLRTLGLANTPSDCAEQLAACSICMARAAQDMSWVAQYGEGTDQEMRDALARHARELDGAARLAESWANAIVAA
jgi:hypothetical protein